MERLRQKKNYGSSTNSKPSSTLKHPTVPLVLSELMPYSFLEPLFLNCTCTTGGNTKSVKYIHWNVKCEKPMTVMPVVSLDHWSTNVKGHYDIGAKSSTQPIFFPERLQSDLYRCSRYLYAHVYIAYLHYATVYMAGYPATRSCKCLRACAG